MSMMEPLMPHAAEPDLEGTSVVGGHVDDDDEEQDEDPAHPSVFRTPMPGDRLDPEALREDLGAESSKD
jgi:hypothetical protein